MKEVIIILCAIATVSMFGIVASRTEKENFLVFVKEKVMQRNFVKILGIHKRIKLCLDFS